MNKETRKDCLTLVAFSIQQSKTQGDNNAVAEFKAEVSSFDFEKPVTQSEAVGSSFDVLKDLAKISKNTDADDRAVVAAEMIFRTLVPVSSNTSRAGNLIDQLKNLFRRRRN